jgi:hypothetical protein
MHADQAAASGPEPRAKSQKLKAKRVEANAAALLVSLEII